MTHTFCPRAKDIWFQRPWIVACDDTCLLSLSLSLSFSLSIFSLSLFIALLCAMLCWPAICVMCWFRSFVSILGSCAGRQSTWFLCWQFSCWAAHVLSGCSVVVVVAVRLTSSSVVVGNVLTINAPHMKQHIEQKDEQ